MWTSFIACLRWGYRVGERGLPKDEEPLFQRFFWIGSVYGVEAVSAIHPELISKVTMISDCYSVCCFYQ